MSHTGKLGAAHTAQVLELRKAFEAVYGAANSDFMPLLKTEMQRLTDWRARIAVVGQVKAGKSTFLGALVGHPGFLPSEVTPWTSVITNLHFGHPDDPTSGGVFHFFGEDDWQRIIEGDATTRKLAEELLPGFRSEVLASQVEMMRERARKRLGRFYNVLLGREHRYDYISPEILERYVCAGAEDEDPDNVTAAKAGRYSDITERADIYFPPSNCAMPAVFTDTPGVNDPFLVRDEFTCRSLLQSDVFVVTLSVHQALTEVDLGLVQMLAAHKGKRIIIYINRIDELDDFAVSAPKIQRDVKARVSEAITDRNFDVVIGSAVWAELAVSGEDIKGVNQALSRPGMDTYLRNVLKCDASDPVQRLRAASGLVAVEEALDSAISAGVGKKLRDETSEALSTITSALVVVQRGQLEQITSALASDTTEDTLKSAVQASHSSRSDVARKISAELKDLFDDAEDLVSDFVSSSWDSFRRELDLIGKGFIEDRTDDLLEIIKSKSESSFEIDTLALRRQLEEQISKSYGSAREKLDFVLKRTGARALSLMQPLLGEARFTLETDNLPHNDVAPIYLTSVQTLMLELTGQRGWKFWKSSKLSPEQAATNLKRVILAEFYPSIENLAMISHEALVERASEAMRRLINLSTVTIGSISEQIEAAEVDTGETDTDEAALKTRLSSDIAAIEQKIETLQTVLTSLDPDQGGDALRQAG